MRLIVSQGGEDAPSEDRWVAELDAALGGRAAGPEADAWRELCADVRALEPPPSPELMRRLERGFAELAGSPARAVAARPSARRPLTRGRVLRVAAAALGAVLVVAAVVVGAGYGGRSGGAGDAVPHSVSAPAGSAPAESAPAESAPAARAPAASALAAGAAGSAAQPAGAAPGRVEQLAAFVGLEAAPADVQAVSDGVARVAVREEGFVMSSHVQVQRHGASEATLALRLPSARLGVALAAIGRLAPVSSESQSLQDVTSEYDSARGRVADAAAERAALLRALAKATTEGEIDSLRERLAQSRAALARARATLAAVSRRASTAEVEVMVLGDAPSGSEGLTLPRGVHDAGRVLTLAAIVALIAAAALVPLALVLAALAGARRLWRRYARERVLRM